MLLGVAALLYLLNLNQSATSVPDIVTGWPQKSCKNVNDVLALEAVVGFLPPDISRLLYMTRVDPSSFSGCNVMPDVSTELLGYWRMYNTASSDGYFEQFTLYACTSVYGISSLSQRDMC